MQGEIIIIQGGQYGSEGKGQVAAVVAQRRGVKHAVRTGSINAGHTVIEPNSGKRVKMQIIPTAWVVPNVMLYLGPGTYIHARILQQEIDFIKEITGEDITKRLLIDHRCSVFGQEEYERAKLANRHHVMGATGKGCSEAVISRLTNRGKPENWKDEKFVNTEMAKGLNIVDVPHLLMAAYHHGDKILLEGTQGSLLDFILGDWPFTTNRMTNSAAWLAEAGLPTNLKQTIILVCRTYPIRVAGNSGKLADEITWSDLGNHINRRLHDLGLPDRFNHLAMDYYDFNLESVIMGQFQEVFDVLGERAADFPSWTESERLRFRECLSEAPTEAFNSLPELIRKHIDFMERTTVTNKIRRIGNLNLNDLRQACLWNNPDEIILTFFNYPFPETWDVTSLDASSSDYYTYIKVIEDYLGVKVSAITTGPNPEHQIEISRPAPSWMI